MRPIFLAFVALFLVPLAATAQERANTILVLDGSGSMWGQIEGINKIVIAREVVAEILADFPADQNLGLTVYGQRTRGDCTDIETVVPPGIDNRQTILDAVNAINPRGKTPMTDAVIAAAEALRYTEEAATVILVSDGIETCNPDVCAAAQTLEQAGIDFTAHVIGFDVTEAAALAQMQCIAEETGGQFLTASNADELSQALTQIATAPEPEQELAEHVFTARQNVTQRVLEDPVVWTIKTNAGETVIDGQEVNPFLLTLEDGQYVVSAYRALTGETKETSISTTGFIPVIVNFSFDDPAPQASLTAPDSVPGGTQFQVGWEGPNENLDNVQIGPVEGGYSDYTYVTQGNPVTLIAPMQPGVYELRYRLNDRETIATRPITVTEPPLGLDAPDSVGIGATITVTWTGPDAPGDNIQIGPAEGGYSDYTYTSVGNPITLIAPGTPGTYELRYRFRDNETVFTRPIEVTEVPLSLDGPETVTIGADFQVAWVGPDAPGDNIQIGPIGGGYTDYSYTSNGSPVTLTAPPEAGDYELRYRFRDNETILTVPISVVVSQASVSGPATAVAGDTITVTWDGPDNDRDFVSIAALGEDRYVNYTYTREGSPLQLLMPAEPGDYELRYQLREGGTVIARQPITVTPVSATLVVPGEAVVGETIQIGWDGPDYDRDYISIAQVSEDRYLNYTYTREGNPLGLLMPTDPGTYEVRYQLQQGGVVVARQSINVTDVKATLIAPDTAIAGEPVSVAWEGPDYENDYIAVGLPGERYINYTRTRQGNPLDLLMPTDPGTYEIRYHLQQDGSIIGTRLITVTEAQASLTAPDTATAGEPLTVGWVGPDYDNDYISVGVPGERYINYTRTRQGNPLELLMPTEPGTYELRYQLQQDGSIIATRPITVTAVTASLTAPDSAPIGMPLSVGWTGPDYDNDYLSVGVPGERYINYTRTRQGNPLELLMPTEPGTYELRYQLQQDGSIIATRPITITDVKASLTAPETAAAGALVTVGWDGPGYDNDYISVGVPGERYISYTRTNQGNPLQLSMPIDPGTYEIRYQLQQDGVILGTQLITVTPVSAQIVVPPSVSIEDATVTVGWDGPGYDNDYISISVPGDDGYIYLTRTRTGNPVEVRLPDAPGTYEVRYVMHQGATVLATAPLVVSAQ